MNNPSFSKMALSGQNIDDNQLSNRDENILLKIDIKPNEFNSPQVSS